MSIDNIQRGDADVFGSGETHMLQAELCRAKMLMAFDENHVFLQMLNKEKQARQQATQDLDHLTATIHTKHGNELVETERGAALSRAQKYISHLTATIRYFQDKTGEYGRMINDIHGKETWCAHLSTNAFAYPQEDQVINSEPAQLPPIEAVSTGAMPLSESGAEVVVVPTFTDGECHDGTLPRSTVTYILKEMEDRHCYEMEQLCAHYSWEIQTREAYYTTMLLESTQHKTYDQQIVVNQFGYFIPYL